MVIVEPWELGGDEKGDVVYKYKGKAEVLELEEKDLTFEEKNSIKKQGLKIITGIPSSYNRKEKHTKFLKESDLIDLEKSNVVEERKNKHTYDELKMLSKKEQTELLNKFGIINIPKLEKDRIITILAAEKK